MMYGTKSPGLLGYVGLMVGNLEILSLHYYMLKS